VFGSRTAPRSAILSRATSGGSGLTCASVRECPLTACAAAHTVGMRVTYDPDADAAYIYLTDIREGGVSASRVVDQPMDRASVHVEFDDRNRLIGIEVLGASRGLPAETLKAAEHP
jgi:uncharacterized protein YuzE